MPISNLFSTNDKNGVLAALVFNMILLTSSAGTAASLSPETLPTNRSSCGDYSILSSSSNRAIFEHYCGTNKESDYRELLTALDRLDPLGEAHAAATRGDFRMAGITSGGPPRPGTRHQWEILGVECTALDDTQVSIFVRISDSYASAAHAQFDSRMAAFTSAYNSALIRENRFPAQPGCKQKID